MEQMTTLAEVINNLREQGYTEDFNLQPNALHSAATDIVLHPEDFVIDRHYRFEGPSDPDEEAVVYAISSTDGKVKGVLVNSYGVYSDDTTDELVKKLKERKDTY
ncbi:phosphoribosylpyrophosphate synthetase [Mucilaginibacter sp. RS28]|uniref:Phosphoribosylpyrophosphate synthetase n=1 Tax=Mucilaginibacter straminoryzae TaxID=2932774 RepID=A0A9X2BA64_9SPHI|nr:phosphoribosylpyrophosphate synthetase [Mucilaginibacter straminoryzae]MCJ8211454.1 phosphoribosylpyrophosphate synthetase [Mucilaginibacter straminoryzae]